MTADELNRQFPEGYELRRKPSEAPTKDTGTARANFATECIALLKAENAALDAIYLALGQR